MKWFKHMSDASEDEFLSEIEEIFGWEGYGRWWKLLEVVANQMDKTDKCSASFSWKDWQHFLKGKRNKLETFLIHCENKSKLFRKQNGNILEIKIPKLLELRDNHTKHLQVTYKQEAEKKDTDTEVDTTLPNAREIEEEISFNEVWNEVAKLTGGRVTDPSPIAKWLSSGATKELILTTLKDRLSKKPGQAPPASLRYYDGAIADAIAYRDKPLPEGNTNGRTGQRMAGAGRAVSKQTGFAEQDYNSGTEGFAVIG